jgi:prophage antirepressor-like protein
MTSLTQFAFNSQQVRIVSINNEPWFVATDVCEILDIRNVSKACNPLKDREKQVLNLYEMGITSSDDPDTTRLLAVSESGLYRLTMKSRKPQAEPFQDWVCEEILPTIRKTGKYEIAPTQPAIPQTLSEALRFAADLEDQKQKLLEANQTLQDEIQVLEPKAIIYDTVMDSDTWLDIRELHKCLAIPKYREKDFRAFLCHKDVKILSKETSQPYSTWIHGGLAKLTPVTLPTGNIYHKPVFSWKGCEKIINALRGHGVIMSNHQIDLNLGFKVVKS